jgi:hypothetical protein
LATSRRSSSYGSAGKKHKKRKKLFGGNCSVPFEPYVAIQQSSMNCRSNCGACCIAPSISTPIPGMPLGKPAGVRCVQLLSDYRCALFGKSGRPAVCVSLRPTESMCGSSLFEAMDYLARLEQATQP